MIHGGDGGVAGHRWHVTAQQRPLLEGLGGGLKMLHVLLWNKSLLFYGEWVYIHWKPLDVVRVLRHLTCVDS